MERTARIFFRRGIRSGVDDGVRGRVEADVDPAVGIESVGDVSINITAIVETAILNRRIGRGAFIVAAGVVGAQGRPEVRA
jgi:hypothetical protein